LVSFLSIRRLLPDCSTQQIIQDEDVVKLTALGEAPIRDKIKVRPGVIADFSEDGGEVRFEELRASWVVEDAEQVQFATDGCRRRERFSYTRGEDHHEVADERIAVAQGCIPDLDIPY
jgi:hypothetical protein